MGADKFANSVTALQTVATCEDSEDHETVKENAKELVQISQDMHDNGLEVDFEEGVCICV